MGRSLIAVAWVLFATGSLIVPIACAINASQTPSEQQASVLSGAIGVSICVTAGVGVILAVIASATTGRAINAWVAATLGLAVAAFWGLLFLLR